MIRSTLTTLALFVFTFPAFMASAEVLVNDEQISPIANVDATYTPPPKLLERIIPQVGVIMSSYTGGADTKYTYKTGLQTGVTMDLGAGDLTFETGLLYRQMGSAYDNSSGAVPGYRDLTGSATANYLTLPFTGKWYFSGQEATSGFLKFGLLPSVLLSNSATVDQPFVNVQQNLNNVDLDFQIGLGAKIRASESFSIVIDATYMRGLTAISSSGDTFDSAFGLNTGFALEM